MSADQAVLSAFGPEPEGRPAVVVVDWESHDKQRRQAAAPQLLGMVTTIRPDGADAVARVRAHGFRHVVCRIDSDPARAARQIEAVRAQGGTAVLLPMWRSLHEVEAVRRLADGLEVGVMVETAEAVDACRHLVDCDVRFAFVGLVDLAIDRGTSSIFAPLRDGTLDRIAESLVGVPLGFGGHTLPGGGHPIPNRLLLGELARLHASFSVMRRSFLTDLADRPPSDGVRAIRAAIATAHSRPTAQVSSDRRELLDLLQGLADAE